MVTYKYKNFSMSVIKNLNIFRFFYACFTRWLVLRTVFNSAPRSAKSITDILAMFNTVMFSRALGGNVKKSWSHSISLPGDVFSSPAWHGPLVTTVHSNTVGCWVPFWIGPTLQSSFCKRFLDNSCCPIVVPLIMEWEGDWLEVALITDKFWAGSCFQGT